MESGHTSNELHLEKRDVVDLELNRVHSAHLINNVVHDFSWKNLNVKVKDRKTMKPLSILTDSNGFVEAGEMIAIMGPSGSGKTTLLNALAHREAAAGATTNGDIMANGQQMSLKKIRQLSSYVEQEDALIGSLTVRETMMFAAGLGLSSKISKRDRQVRIDDLIASFGLQDQAHTIVGTPIKKGLSGGQKKRLGVASRLVTDPKILFLDEPTSGLDSTLSFEVMNFIRTIAKRNKLIVVASIHQPSSSTFKLFDKLCLLSKGKMCYFGPLPEAHGYFQSIGYPMPPETNPAEFYLDLINTDLAKAGDEVFERIGQITQAWSENSQNQRLIEEIDIISRRVEDTDRDLSKFKVEMPAPWVVPMVLLQRSWIKSYRDIVTYGIRVIMYLGLAILMGTVFLRLKSNQEYIQPFINSIFFGSAFISFMAVAYVPAFLEDRATFAKERANGLVGPFAFVISNFIIGLPFLFLISALFSLVTYFLSNFRMNGNAFFMYTMWLFLDLLAAESLVVLVSAIFPVFVVSLAVTAFANGLWMCVDGFLVPMNILNPFWKYVFHYIDYQSYVFQGMMVNQFKASTYTCDSTGSGYHCSYPSDLNSEGKIDGKDVLSAFSISPGKENEWIGIMLAIIAVYRVFGYVVFHFKKN
ncbi:putative ATP-binding cassette transporter [Lepidopterella palustris CBS 459.81]|uniref:Putative ATP-binding cassette transporter n=1 Tax=Lepidopterella palustris CBS 459.81 TaxID=1314670 RepID=A0A8E2E113_9PEZI|nr:putative ATP-binding cassette transporter [Lepidopterella palustris CBS 459.81]